MKILESLWVEKYRPKEIKDLVIPNDYIEDFTSYFKKGEIPNLLFYGCQGSGKTTLGKIICSENGVLHRKVDNLLIVNGSSKSTRGIDFVDTTIEPFLKVPPSGTDKYKIVFIDEADYLTDNSFSSLRHIIEKYQVSYGRFIFTCNYISKIPPAIQSRFQSYEFEKIPTNFILKYCTDILNNENISFQEEDVKYLIEQLFPDIRKIVNTLQRNSNTGKLRFDKNGIITSEKLIVSSFIKACESLNDKNELNRMLGTIVNSLNESLDYRNLYTTIFQMERVSPIVKILVNKYSNEHKDCLVPSMNFMGMVFESLKSLREYETLRSK